MKNYFELENYLKNAKEALEKAYGNFDTTESEWFSKQLEEVLGKTQELYISMIYELKIEDE